MPTGGAALLRRRIRATVEELNVDEATTVGPVTVRAVVADHDGRRRFGGPTALALGYLLTASRSIYVAGDTDIFPGMRAMAETAGAGGLDVALLPVSGWGLNLGPGHMDAARAAEALALLRPRLVIPVHWGTLRVPVLWRLRPERYVTPGRDFAGHAAVVAPDCRVVIAAPNVPVVVPSADGVMSEPRVGLRPVWRILIVWLVAAGTLLLLAWVLPGFSIDDVWSAFAAAALLGLLNALVWPVLVRLALPLTVLTLGLAPWR